jgi:hypothetical protein
MEFEWIAEENSLGIDSGSELLSGFTGIWKIKVDRFSFVLKGLL